MIASTDSTRQESRQVSSGRRSHPRDLTFVSSRGASGGLDYWSVTATGRHSADFETGTALGKEFTAFIGKDTSVANATLLGPIVSAMISKCAAAGRCGGIELGFLAEVNAMAMVTAAILEREGQP